MSQKDKLECARVAFNKAQNAFHQNPSVETKEAYKAASATFSLALKKAKKSGDFVECENSSTKTSEASIPWTKRSADSIFGHLPAHDAAVLDQLREELNAARRSMYADPSQKRKDAANSAMNEYRKMRLKLDPVFAAKNREIARRASAKHKAKQEEISTSA